MGPDKWYPFKRALRLSGIIYTALQKKVYHPIFNDKIFNSRCPIPVIPGTVITE